MKATRYYFLVLFLNFYFPRSVQALEPVIPSEIKKSIVDIHTHIACLSAKNGCWISEKLRKSFKFKVYMKALGYPENLKDAAGDAKVAERLSFLISQSKFISKAVVLSLDGYHNEKGELDLSKTQVLVPNDFVLAQTKRFSNLVYAASIHPLRVDALSELQKAKTNGAIFIKWIPCIMGIDPASEDKRMTDFYKKLVELKLPLLSHTGDEHSFAESDNRLCDPKRLKRPLDLGVQVIAAHLGTLGKFEGESSLDRIKNLLKKFSDLKFDISSLVNINKFNHVKYALDYPGRYYYGSDYPLIRASLMGIPLNSSGYYRFKLNRKWMKFILSFENDFDRDVALKLALGVPMEDLTAFQVSSPR